MSGWQKVAEKSSPPFFICKSIEYRDNPHFEVDKMSYPKKFQLLLIAMTVAGSFGCVQAQGNEARARAIERADMDRLLLWAVPKEKESESMRVSRFKKIK